MLRGKAKSPSLQQPLYFLDDLRRQRLDRGGPGPREAAVGRDQVFMEVPARHAGLAELGLDPPIERMCLGPDNVLLGGERKTHMEIRRAEFLDLGDAAGLLRAEVVRGHAEDGETPAGEALLH